MAPKRTADGRRRKRGQKTEDNKVARHEESVAGERPSLQHARQWWLRLVRAAERICACGKVSTAGCAASPRASAISLKPLC